MASPRRRLRRSAWAPCLRAAPGGACLAAVASCRAGDLEMDAAPPSSSVYRFGEFVLDRRAGALFRVGEDGSRQEAPLGSRAFALACVLVERRGGIGSRREIMDAVWPGLAVEDNNLTVQLTALRRVLDEGRPGPSAIQTVPRRGYRFVLPVSE